MLAIPIPRDRFLWALFATLAAASVLPVPPDWSKVASLVSQIAIFLLFFLHGLRLPHGDVGLALKNWRLQGGALAFVFLAMPLAGLAIAKLFESHVPVTLATGLLFLTFLPSTVQSAISYCSIARGNVAASVVAAALSNLAGIVLTPLLVFALLDNSGTAPASWETAGRIAAMLLLPFCLGQIAQKWLGGWASGQKTLLSLMDRAAILIAVYVAFSASVTGGIWGTINLGVFAALALAIAALLAYGFGMGWFAGIALRLERRDRTSLLFAGAHKSIATGAPMAALIFPAHIAGTVLLPVIAYHMAQLVISAPIANRIARSTGN